MFTGIIEGRGTVTGLARSGGILLTVKASFPLDGTRIGDSIAVNGACLTAVSIEGDTFSADLSPETASRTAMGKLAPGSRVNLERALLLSSRLDGHLVTGHVDGVGSVSRITRKENAILFSFNAPDAVLRYMVEKGSVAVDGVSLTVNKVSETGFSVSVIPHTAQITTLGDKRPGDPVNLEADIIGKYVERLLAFKKEPEGGRGLSLAKLAEQGFV